MGEYLFTRFEQKSSHRKCFIIQHESHTNNSEFYCPFLTISVFALIFVRFCSSQSVMNENEEMETWHELVTDELYRLDSVENTDRLIHLY